MLSVTFDCEGGHLGSVDVAEYLVNWQRLSVGCMLFEEDKLGYVLIPTEIYEGI
jgi:hypothetical protein